MLISWTWTFNWTNECKQANLEGTEIESCGVLDLALLALNVGQVVLRVGVGGTELQSGVVGRLRLCHQALFFQGVRQVAVRIGEVGLQLDRSTIRVDGQIDQTTIQIDRLQYDWLIRVTGYLPDASTLPSGPNPEGS